MSSSASRCGSWKRQALLLGTVVVMCHAHPLQAEALTLSNINIVPLDHGVTVTWDTNEPAQGTITVSGPPPSWEISITGPWNVTYHEVTAYDETLMAPQQSYQVRVSARAIASGQTVSAGPFTFTTTADVTPPVLRRVRVNGVGSHGAVVTWESDTRQGTGFVDYGQPLTYGQVATATKDLCGLNLQDDCRSRQTAVVTNLLPLTNYQFQVREDDGYGNQAIPLGNFTVLTDSLWSQFAFQPDPRLYFSTQVCVAGTGTGCVGFGHFWPKEMSWTGNEILIQFNAATEDLTRGSLAFEANVTFVQQVNGKWVKLELAAGTDPNSLVVLNPGGLTLDHAGAYSVPMQASLFSPGLNYLRLRGITITVDEMGYGRVAPVAVWDRMQVRFAQLGPAPLSDTQLLDRIETQAARYFWEQAFNSNGFVRDVTNSAQASVGATGFGLAALVVMAERAGSSSEWTVTAAEARARAQKILDAAVAMQGQQAGDAARYGKAGFLFHFIDQEGRRYRNLSPGAAPSESSIEVSTIDTALFLAGALTAGQYFGGEVQTRANQFFANLNWSYFFDASTKQFHHAWQPENYPGFGITPPDGIGYLSNQEWDRPTDEVLLINLLALASNTAHSGFRQSLYSWPRVTRTYAGYDVVNSFFGSLFTYIFGEAFFDFKAMGVDNPASVGASVQPVNWFLNATNAALANRQFAIDQSGNFLTYAPEQWGLSACFRPDGSYFGENGAKPAEFNNGEPSHDGTVPPYGAISTMPLVRSSMSEPLSANLAFQALRHYYNNHFSGLWGPYGPRDSLKKHLQAGQAVTAYSPLYVGIDVGPEVLMIENYRTGLLNRFFMSHPDVRAAVRAQFPNAQFGEPLTILSLTDLVDPFSPYPASPSQKDTTNFFGFFNHDTDWTLTLTYAGDGSPVCTWMGHVVSGQAVDIPWAGHLCEEATPDVEGEQPVAENSVRTFRYVLAGLDAGGSSVSQSGTVTVDTTIPVLYSVKANPTTFSPSLGQTTTITYTLKYPDLVILQVWRGTTKVRDLLINTKAKAGPNTKSWDGRNNANTLVAPGTYTVKCYIFDAAGNKATLYPGTTSINVQ